MTMIRRGTTTARKETVKMLEDKVRRTDLMYGSKGEKMDNPDALVPQTGLFSHIPVRAAKNTPEYYGGVRLYNARGMGDVICQSDQIESVLNSVQRENKMRVLSLLNYAAGRDADHYDVLGMSPEETDRFLAFYDQALPWDGNDTPPLEFQPTEHEYQDPRYQYLDHEMEKRLPAWPEDKARPKYRSFKDDI